MVIFSVYAGLKERVLPMEIIDFSFVGIMFFCEIFQIMLIFKTYFKDLWKMIDILALSLRIVTYTLIWGDWSTNATEWTICFALLFGYFKWVSCLRLFRVTRRIVRMIVEIIKDLLSFFLVVIILLTGFNLIFYRLSNIEGDTFGNELLNNYVVLYSQFDYSDYSAPQVFFFVVVTVTLSMILFNMLIAVMTDTFNRVQTRRKVAESKEKIKLVFESMVVKRTYRRLFCNKKLKRENSLNYLFLVEEGQSQVLFNSKDPLDARLTKLEEQVKKVNELVSQNFEKFPEAFEKLLKQELSHLQLINTNTSLLSPIKKERIDLQPEWKESTKSSIPISRLNTIQTGKIKPINESHILVSVGDQGVENNESRYFD